MSNFLQKFGATTGVDRGAHRLARVVGAESSPLIRAFDAKPDVKDGVGTIAGAAAGAVYGYKKGHWLLGSIGGASLGSNLPALVMHPEQRKLAARNLIVSGSGIAGSLIFDKAPVFGFVLGWVGGAVATYYGGLK